MLLILDSSAFIAFYEELNTPKILCKAVDFGFDIAIPNSVLEEIKKGKTFIKAKGNINKEIKVVCNCNDDIEKMRNRYPFLGDGEIDVILHGAYFKSRNKEYCCILDDKKARRLAEEMKVNFMGTKGMLVFFKDKGLILEGELKDFLDRLENDKFR